MGRGVCQSTPRSYVVVAPTSWWGQVVRIRAARDEEDNNITSTEQKGHMVCVSAQYKYQWSTSEVPVEYQWSTSGVPGEYQWSTSGVPVEYQGSTRGVPVEYQWSTRGVESPPVDTLQPLEFLELTEDLAWPSWCEDNLTHELQFAVMCVLYSPSTRGRVSPPSRPWSTR